MLRALFLKLRSIVVKDDGNKKILIKESTINNLKLIKIEDFCDEENKLILESHKLILRTSKDNNNSNEVMVIVDLINGTISKPVFGTEDETYFGDQLIPNINGKYALCHNHPKCGDFSFEDINTFLSADQIKIMTIITNLGKTKYLYKYKEVNIKPIESILKKLRISLIIQPKAKQEFIDIFIKIYIILV